MTPTGAGRRERRPPAVVAAPLRDLRRAVARHRRLAVAALLAAAVTLALDLVAPSPAATTPVLVAARDLAAGVALGPADLTVRRVPAAARPDGALAGAAPALGRVLGAAARRGEVITDLRLVGAPLAAQYGPDVVATPVRLADADAVGLLRPGDRIDVVAASAGDLGTAPDGSEATSADGGGSGRSLDDVATVLAADVPVVTVPVTGVDGLGGGEGALVLLATDRRVALALAGAAVTSRLTFVLR